MAETSGTTTPKTRSKTGKPSTKKPAAAKKTSAAKTASSTKKSATAKSPAKKEESATKPAAKTAVRKTTARKATKSVSAPASPISAEERRRLIAEAAYLRAEQRGFAGGDPMADWLEAEADIDASLMGPTH